MLLIHFTPRRQNNRSLFLSRSLLPKKRIAFGYDCRSILVANAPATGDDEIKLRLRGVRVVWAIRFALWNSDQREIKRMPLRQVERLRFATERNGHILHELVELALWRFSFLFRNVFQIHFAHTAPFSITIPIP